MLNRIKQWMPLVVVALMLASAHSAQACATCFGKSDSKLAVGLNWGILTLLVIVLSVLGGISAFFIFIVRRTAQVERKQQSARNLGPAQPVR